VVSFSFTVRSIGAKGGFSLVLFGVGILIVLLITVFFLMRKRKVSEDLMSEGTQDSPPSE
jgi:hypothetical protein